MKFIHLSDLHLGKRVNDYSMIKDQRYIINEIFKIIDSEKPDGIFIAGDIYDKPVPPEEAVELFDDMLSRLSEKKIPTFIISGNHDSDERLAFANRIIRNSGIHISPVYTGIIEPIEMKDETGDVMIYMLPFIKPADVRRFYEDECIETYTDAMRVAIDKMNIDSSKINIILTHQFLTGSSVSDSEEISVGGTDNVDVSVFDDFDYVALGHLHGPQKVKRETVRYCGTPLKYSFSEVNHKKSVTVIETAKKGSINIRTIPLVPERDMKEIRGTYAELMNRSYYEGTSLQEDYIHVTLTDEDDIPNAIGNLRSVYHNLMKLDYDNTRTRENKIIEAATAVEDKSPLELYGELFALQNNREMNNEEAAYMQQLIRSVWEENE